MDFIEQLSVVHFSRLAKAAWEEVSNIHGVSPMQSLVTFLSIKAMQCALRGGLQPVSSFYFNVRKWSLNAWFQACVGGSVWFSTLDLVEFQLDQYWKVMGQCQRF